MPWSTRFEDPIALDRGRELVTLEDAARYIQKLPKADQQLEEWQTATAVLIGAAEDRDFLMHARIAVLRALNRDQPAPDPGPRRKRAKAYTIIRS
jgi:hypothetical protein